jgi:hypothetical protein
MQSQIGNAKSGLRLESDDLRSGIGRRRHVRFRGLVLHAGQTTVDFEGWRQAFQPESFCRSDGSSQAVDQTVTDDWRSSAQDAPDVLHWLRPNRAFLAIS